MVRSGVIFLMLSGLALLWPPGGGAGPVVPPTALTAAAYRPDGQVLAVAERGRVLLLDAEGEPLAVVSDLPPKVTALAFSPDGRHLAVAAGRPGQLGELHVFAVPAVPTPTEPPTRLYTLSAHRDLIHDVAYSPDGKLLATCSYDRLAKLWNAADGAERATLRDHSDAIYGLAFRPDGKLLATAAADRTVKLWDVATGQRLYTLSESTDWLYSVAFSPDGKRVAAAGVDRTVRLWDVNDTEGRLAASAFAHERPVLQVRFAANGQTLFTLGEDDRLKSWDAAKLTERQVLETSGPTLRFALRPDGKELALARATRQLALVDLGAGRVRAEPLPPRLPLTAVGSIPVQPPAALIGTLAQPGAEWVVPLTVAAGEELGVEVRPLFGSALAPQLELRDEAGQVLAEGIGAALGWQAQSAGTVRLAIRDASFRGGAGFAFRVRLGPVPVITGLFPLGAPRGQRAVFQLQGVHLGTHREVTLDVPATAKPGSQLDLLRSVEGQPVANPRRIVVGEWPEVTQEEGKPGLESPLTWPVTINGRCEPIGLWRFAAQAGQTIIAEVEARRLGSPLDSVIEILDLDQRPIPVATLRCVGQTFVTLRNHDSRGGGIRIENWDGFAINDYLFGNGELMRIFELPRNNDDDIRLFTAGGQRLGFLGTTTSYHGLGAPLYRVEVHPPGASFPPNGYPVFTLDARNDDGGAGFGKDSRLTFTAPRTGEYLIRISDARNRSDPRLVYRLTLRLPRPDFDLRAEPKRPAIPKGGAVAVTVTANRRDGHHEAIPIEVLDLPPGVQAPPTAIPAGESSTTFALFADAEATLPAEMKPLVVVGTAGGQTRRAEIGTVTLSDPGEIVTRTTEPALRLTPGGTVSLTVQIERRGEFKARVPIEVRGLPHGVRVQDVGLNGILITEADTERTMSIYCEPWVAPQLLQIAVVARSEKSGRGYAARGVRLEIGPPAAMAEASGPAPTPPKTPGP